MPSTRTKAVMIVCGLVSGGCGGGGQTDGSCTSGVAGLCAMVGATAGTQQTSSAALFTTAPDVVTMSPGTSAVYTIGGGTGSYTAMSSDTNVAKVSVSGSSMTIQSVAAGSATIAITDSAGKKVMITVNQGNSPDQLVALYTTAPTAVTLPSGGAVTYQVGGGAAPYTVSSGNPSVVGASVSGTTLKIDALWQQSASSAPTQIEIVDAKGARVSTGVTVLGKGQTGIPPSIYPASITLSDCTTNVPFVFTGGTPPFTVYTGDNARVPVSAPLPFGPDSYFTADVHVLTGGAFPFSPTSDSPYKVTLTVMDSQSRTATANALVASQFACPTNAKLEVQAGSTVAKVTEKITFQVTGGQPPFTVTSRNQTNALEQIAQTDAAAILSDGGYSFTVTALSTGGTSFLTGASLITVTSHDGQQKNIVLTVYPKAPQ